MQVGDEQVTENGISFYYNKDSNTQPQRFFVTYRRHMRVCLAVTHVHSVELPKHTNFQFKTT